VLEALTILAGYLIGSIDVGGLTARRHGVDIYATGSGNPGASNISRTLGRRQGAVVMGADVLKGIAAAALGELVGGSELVGFAAGAMAVVGHCFPVWHRFRGGKGVSTGGGMLLWTIPGLGLALGVVWGAVVAVTRMSSLGSLTIAVLAVPGVAIWARHGWSAVIMAAVSLLVVARHRDNIERMFREGEQTL
jgi:glycerol-3-phosphate acyltransferase PlsY